MGSFPTWKWQWCVSTGIGTYSRSGFAFPAHGDSATATIYELIDYSRNWCRILHDITLDQGSHLIVKKEQEWAYDPGTHWVPHAPTPTRCLPSEPFENTAQVTAWMLHRVRMRWHQVSAHYTVLSSQWVKPMGPLNGNGSRPGPSDLIGDFALSCHCTLSLLICRERTLLSGYAARIPLNCKLRMLPRWFSGLVLVLPCQILMVNEQVQ